MKTTVDRIEQNSSGDLPHVPMEDSFFSEVESQQDQMLYPAVYSKLPEIKLSLETTTDFSSITLDVPIDVWTQEAQQLQTEELHTVEPSTSTVLSKQDNKFRVQTKAKDMRQFCGRGAKQFAYETCTSYNRSAELMKSGSKAKFAEGVVGAVLTTVVGATGGVACTAGYVASGAVEQGTKFAKHLKGHTAEPSISTVLPEQDDKFRVQTKAKKHEECLWPRRKVVSS